MKAILQPAMLGGLALGNRVAMAPVTRSRAGRDGVPDDLAAQYYQQRASAGLLISEATNVSTMSAAFELAPGIYTPEQVAGWRRVAAAVHRDGGKLFMQLWHSGRVSSYALLGGAAPLSPSGVNDDLHLLQVYGMLRNGQYTRIAASPSRAMEREEIFSAVRAFGIGAANALDTGLDGVEIHAANGYLPQQFLSSLVNRRTDDFGGGVENRARFLRLVIESVMLSFPASRIGVRISPFALYNNAGDPALADTYGYLLRMLEEYGVGYVHAADTNAWGGVPDMDELLSLVRANYGGFVIANGGLSPEAADGLIRDGRADMVSFGRQFIANPDLVRRIAQGGPYNEPDPFTFYGGGSRGYVDYPALAA
ncbi:alkene reductase [Massilia dura]|uniref:Alkene reductase n=1 Tax=Pseudoduganella dura TaxID=321982 RepID=A0A6I3XH43_9BURK|nr:alkene reductase [Pseudoduganella dura]MUI13713.1 alkene reductase [Pseudoduganella dura]GGX74884.1 alkene reductase [Pseudoduganella dura]